MVNTKNIIVKNIKHLKDLTIEGCNEYAISLAGGLGVYSRKTIMYKPHQGLYKFFITNHIDGTKQKLNDVELFDPQLTNIGKAIPLNSLIAIID